MLDLSGLNQYFTRYVLVLSVSPSYDFVGAPLLNEPSDDDSDRIDVVGDDSPFKLLQTISARRGSTSNPMKLATDDRRSDIPHDHHTARKVFGAIP